MRIKFNARYAFFVPDISVYRRRRVVTGNTIRVLILYGILNFNQTVDLPIKKLFSLCQQVK